MLGNNFEDKEFQEQEGPNLRGTQEAKKFIQDIPVSKHFDLKALDGDKKQPEAAKIKIRNESYDGKDENEASPLVAAPVSGQDNGAIERKTRLQASVGDPSLKHLIHLEHLMSYLMSINRFFGCLQIEVYLYYITFFISAIFFRQVLTDPHLSVISSPFVPICVLYLIFFIKTVSKIRNKIDLKRSWVQISAISCYLLFIVSGCLRF